MVDNIKITPIGEPKREVLIDTKPKYNTEEKVEVLIKEVVRIRPADFQAFKRALEEFFSGWDK